MSLKDYLLRHKSVDNYCFPSQSASSNGIERFYFFDDDKIKKLTNHLFEITTNHYSDHNNNSHISDLSKDVEKEKVEEIDEKKLSTASNGIVEEDEGNSYKFSAIFKKFTALADSGNVSVQSSQMPWVSSTSTKRTKFKLNQTSSRDVPIVKTEKPARLKKQNAIDDASDMKLFDETFTHKPTVMKSIVDIFNENIVETAAATQRQETFVSRLPNGNFSSSSFDCGQLGVEQRSMNTIRALFQLHAATGTSVKNILGQIEAKNKF